MIGGLRYEDVYTGMGRSKALADYAWEEVLRKIFGDAIASVNGVVRIVPDHQYIVVRISNLSRITIDKSVHDTLANSLMIHRVVFDGVNLSLYFWQPSVAVSSRSTKTGALRKREIRCMEKIQALTETDKMMIADVYTMVLRSSDQLKRWKVELVVDDLLKQYNMTFKNLGDVELMTVGAMLHNAQVVRMEAASLLNKETRLTVVMRSSMNAQRKRARDFVDDDDEPAKQSRYT